MKKIILCLGLVFLTNCTIQSTNPIGIGTTPSLDSLVPTSDYVIYSDCATLPTLYIAINMLTHNKPSFMYMGRPNTIDITKIPDHVTMIANDDDMRLKIAELNVANPNATFTFYMNDLRIAKVFSHFYSQGIPASRVKVVMLSDGTGTYNSFAEQFSSQNAMKNWEEAEDKYKAELAKTPAPYLYPDHFYGGDGGPNTFLTAPAIEQNTSFWMQWPELLVSDSADLKKHLQENGKRYNKVDPLKYYQSLSSENQQKFFTLVGLDKKWADGEGDGTLKNQTIGEALDASPNPNIIIIGTNPFGGGGNKTDAYIARVKAKYGDEYDYFFKGHPETTTHPADKSIVVLPFRLPMEAIIWAYGNKISVLGGYQSSLYMNAPKEIDKFFFAISGGSSLLAPLNIMYKQGLLGKVEFFN